MNKNPKIALVAAASALLLAGQAHALTLTNRDAVEQRLQIVEGDEMPVTQDFVINANQTLYRRILGLEPVAEVGRYNHGFIDRLVQTANTHSNYLYEFLI